MLHCCIMCVFARARQCDNSFIIYGDWRQKKGGGGENEVRHSKRVLVWISWMWWFWVRTWFVAVTNRKSCRSLLPLDRIALPKSAVNHQQSCTRLRSFILNILPNNDDTHVLCITCQCHWCMWWSMTTRGQPCEMNFSELTWYSYLVM